MENRYSKVLTIILVVIILAILLLLGFLLFDYIKKVNITKQASEFVETYQGDYTTGEVNTNTNTVENKNTETVSNTTEENITINKNETTINTTSGNTTTTSTKKQFRGFTVLGTMKIPAINLEYPIVEEVTSSALENALVLLYPTGEHLNQVGNTVIIGHNYRNGTFFSNVKKLNNGDKIYVTDFRGVTITYEVYNRFLAKQTDTSFYTRDTNGLAEITLSTCTDSSDDQRTIVFAKQLQ